MREEELGKQESRKTEEMGSPFLLSYFPDSFVFIAETKSHARKRMAEN
jgi:hypothetical protein